MVRTYVDVRYALVVPPIREGDLPGPGAEGSRGRVLCQGCQRVLTATILPAAACVLGVALACCPACQVRLRRG